MYPHTMLSAMLTNIRPTPGGAVTQAVLHGRGKWRLDDAQRPGAGARDLITTVGATGICCTDLYFRNVGSLSCQYLKKTRHP